MVTLTDSITAPFSTKRYVIMKLFFVKDVGIFRWDVLNGMQPSALCDTFPDEHRSLRSLLSWKWKYVFNKRLSDTYNYKYYGYDTTDCYVNSGVCLWVAI